VEKSPKDEHLPEFKEDGQVLEDDQQVQAPRKNLILEEICNEFIKKEVKIQETVRVDQAAAVEENPSKAPEDPLENKTTTKPEPIKKEKINMSMLKNLFQSLSDELADNEVDNDIASLSRGNQSLLSKSSKKIRQKTVENPSVYNKILNGIMKVEPSQVKKPLKRLSPTTSRQEASESSKENTPMNRQKQTKICFKGQVPQSTSMIPPLPPKNNTTKLVQTKVYDYLDQLSHRFKLDLQQSEQSKSEKLNSSMFNDSKRLQLRIPSSQSYKDNQHDEKVPAPNMNINKYLNAFCRSKFND
jgi:hypothetical protein